MVSSIYGAPMLRLSHFTHPWLMKLLTSKKKNPCPKINFSCCSLGMEWLVGKETLGGLGGFGSDPALVFAGCLSCIGGNGGVDASFSTTGEGS